MPKNQETTRPQEIKQPRRMEVKTLIPWMIIVIMTTFISGVWMGWSARSDQLNQIKSEVAEQVRTISSVKK